MQWEEAHRIGLGVIRTNQHHQGSPGRSLWGKPRRDEGVLTRWDLALGMDHDNSVQSHSISWTYGSSPLAAHTHLHASSVGLWSLLLSDLITSTGHLTYILVPT